MNSPGTVLLEREHAIEGILRLAGRVREGRGGGLFIVAKPGLGKTACLDTVKRAAAPGIQCAIARGDPMETGLPFGVVTQLCRSIGADAALPPAGLAPAGYDPRGTQLYRVIRWFAEEAEGPIMLAVDDLHWADADSLAVLSSLCRRISARPLGVVAALRPWPPVAEEVALNLVQAGCATLEHLEALSPAATEALLIARTGGRVPAEMLTGAARICGGNPLLLEELALTTCSHSGPAGIEAIGSAKKAQSLLISRFAGLPLAAIRYAQAGSLFGNRFRPSIVADIAQLSHAELIAGMEALCRNGLVHASDGGCVEFSHPLFRQALYEDLPPPVRELLHARAFAALRQRGLQLEAAAHAVSGRRVGDPEAVQALIAAAEEAAHLGATATAAEHLEGAVELSGSHPDHDLLIALGAALLAAYRAADAVGVLERLLDDARLGSARRPGVLRLLGRALFIAGAPRMAERRFEQAAAQGGEGKQWAGGRAQALLDGSQLAWLTRGPRAALQIAEGARVVARHAGAGIAVSASVAWGVTSFVSGNPQALDTVAKAVRPIDGRSAPDPMDAWWNWDALRSYGRLAQFAERFDRAQQAFEIAATKAERSGNPHARALVAADYADMLIRLGRLHEALGHTERAGALGDIAPTTRSFVGALRAHVLLLLGRREEALSVMASAGERAVLSGQWLPQLWLWHLRGQVLMRDGEVDGAGESYDRIEAAARELGVAEACVVPWGRHAVAAHLAGGREGDARRVIDWLDDCSARYSCRWPAAAAAWGRAMLSDHRGEITAADASYRLAVAQLGTVPLRVEQAAVHLDHGAFLRRRGLRKRGREVLAVALGQATALGAVWLQTEAQAELVAAGARPRRERTAPDILTNQEQRVAGLAATGMSNKQIASRLSISTKTVDTHLMRVYGKLGLHSRRQLMEGMAMSRAD